MPVYRLQVLLEMRERAEKEARGLLHEQTELLASEEVKRERLRAEKQRHIELRLERHNALTQQMRDQTMSVGQVQAEQLVLDKMALEIKAMADGIERQDRSIKERKARVKQEAKNLAKKSSELDAIQEHKANWIAKHQPGAQDPEAAPGSKAPPRREADGVREKLVFRHEMAAQGVRDADPDRPASEIPGLDITPDNLRRSEAEGLPPGEKSGSRLPSEELCNIPESFGLSAREAMRLQEDIRRTGQRREADVETQYEDFSRHREDLEAHHAELNRRQDDNEPHGEEPGSPRLPLPEGPEGTRMSEGAGLSRQQLEADRMDEIGQRLFQSMRPRKPDPPEAPSA